MRLLLVEDDETGIEELTTAIQGALADAELIIARSRDSAFSTLDNQWFDLVVTDLKLPTVDFN